MEYKSVDERQARQAEIRTRLGELDSEYAGRAMTEDAKQEWNSLNEERDEHEKIIVELEARAKIIEAQAKSDEKTAERGASFAPVVRKSDSDIYDLASIRAESRNEDQHKEALRDAALRSVERSTFPKTADDAQGDIERLLDQNRAQGEVARLVLATGAPAYRRAFEKAVKGQQGFLTNEERTAFAIGVTTTGAFAVPYTLDPTLIHTGNFIANPFRAICRNVTITGSTTWQGLSNAGVVASFDNEAAEVSDDGTAIAQPTATLRMARAFVSYSIETEDDWSGFAGEMASLFADAKDELEGTAFTTGSGTAPNPLGILETANTAGVGTAAFKFTAGTAAFAVADVYALENALKPRSRKRATVMANRATYNAIRQFDTAGGAQLWQDNLRVGLTNSAPGGVLGQSLLGYPAVENSVMSSTYTTTGQLSMVLGDFNQFVIVDGVGMTVEPISHLFHTSNNLPSFQRGLTARWRTATAVTDASAFKILKVL